MTPAAEKPTRLGILLRVGLFILIGWLGVVIFPFIIYPLAGLMVTSAMATFAAAAVANAITVRIYERGRLADLGLGWAATSKRELFIGFAAAAGAAVVILVGPVVTGFANFERSPGVEHPWASFLFVSLVLLFGAAGEEMLFHGYAFQLLVRSIGAFATILPVSILFGLRTSGQPELHPARRRQYDAMGRPARLRVSGGPMRCGCPSACISAGTSPCPCSA